MSRRTTIAAIGIGLVLAGQPVVALYFWLDRQVARQGQEEVKESAQRSVALAENRIGQVVSILDQLAAQGVDGCQWKNVETMRRATFATTPMKELSIVAADGRTLCTDIGNPAEERRVVSSEPASAGGQTLLEVVQLGGKPQRWVRILRPGAGSANGIAGLMPVDLFVARVSIGGGPLGSHAQMQSASGSLIGEAGRMDLAAGRDDVIVATHESKRYAIKATASVSKSALAARSSDPRILLTVASGLLALLILSLAFLLSRRQRDNPIADMERALKAGEFVPYYQPIVDIRSGRLRGAEVLIRWRRADGSVVSPATFIPLAESSGLIVEMTRVLMRRVCQEAGPVIGLRPHFKISFNLAACHFANEEIVDDVRKIFKKSPLRLSQLVLEVTERQPLDNLTEPRRIIAALQGLGVKVAIDDVGTGHSGLSYILKLGADIIKIDKMFVDSLGTDRNSNTIVETLIDLARNMRMEVIAEGVENFEQVVHLRELGINAAQGFVFAPPLPGSAFLRLVEAIDPINPAEAQSVDTPLAAAAHARFDAA